MMIRTERLILKPLTIDDWSFMLNLLNQPDFIENIGDKNKMKIKPHNHQFQIKKNILRDNYESKVLDLMKDISQKQF